MSYSEQTKVFTELFAHKMSDEQMRELLLSMKLDENTSVEAIAAAAAVMRSNSIRLPVAKELRPRLLDVVGTGGDKIGSFNISSTVSILCASAGAYVAKHGSRSITSKSGSADMFESLGIKLDLNIEQNAKLLEETGFCFMFAQNHHPAMKFIMPIRKSINEKTIFNVLGPLTNPAGVQKSMLGVFDKSFVPKIAQALKINDSTSALVVSSREHMDEISISDITYAARLYEGKITEFEIDPMEYGIKRAPLEAIVGADAKQNALILYNIFNNTATQAQKDIVLINAAASLMIEGMARDIQDGLEIVREAILSKKALEKLNEIIRVSSIL